MNFDEAYARMKQGQAIAHPHWKTVAYLFWARDTMWRVYKNGKFQPMGFISSALCDATDWITVKVEKFPTVPEPKPKPVTTGRKWESLESKQRRMRERCAD